jgi:filamentous hemagglutinin family protein
MNRTAWMFGLLGSLLISTIPVSAQVSSDGSTGTIVTPNGNVFDITGGTTVGGRNLFHSFDRFDVSTLGAANFLNDPSIVNIFSRVTGGKVSEIDGVLRSRGTANFFLMNPSGIVFKENASLDIGGSFVATTANALRFPTGVIFSLDSPVSPSDFLLAINPSAFLFNQTNTAAIQNISQANAGLDPSNSFSTFGLRVPDGKSLILLGDDVVIDRGGLVAFGGRIDIGAAAIGSIGLSIDGNLLQLKFPHGSVRRNVLLANQAGLIVASDQKGSITINAQNVQLSGRSTIQAGIGFKLGKLRNKAGNITIDATGALVLTENSLIQNQVYSEAIGEGGNIVVQAESVILKGASQISTGTFGHGNAGNITINAEKTVELIGAIFSEETGFSSALFARAERGSQGNAGNINVNAQRVLVNDGAQISTRSRSIGRAGNLIIDASDTVELTGTVPQTDFRSRLISAGFSGSQGGGDIIINTGRLLVSNGAIAVTSTFGNGRAGSMTVNAANSVELSGVSNDGAYRSSLFSQSGSSGKAANLTINTKQLVIRDGALASASTSSSGQAGNLLVNAAENVQLIGTSPDERFRSALAAETSGNGNAANLMVSTAHLKIQNGAVISTSTLGSGQGGTIEVNADSIELINVSENGRFRSGIGSETSNALSGGNAGNVKLSSRLISIRDGAIISTSTFGTGRGGSIEGNFDSLELNGISKNGQFRSAIASETVGDDTIGDAGAIKIITRLLSVQNQGVLSGSTFSRGNGGNINIIAESVRLNNNAQIVVQSQSKGRAGNIAIRASIDLNANNSQVIAASEQAGGGSISIDAKNIFLRNSSTIRTDLTIGQAKGGNIILAANAIVALENSDILAFAPEGIGGNITFNTRAFLSNPLYRQTPPTLDRNALNDLLTNGRVDVNASGAVSGTVAGVPDITFLQNSLTQLSQNAIDTNALLANSCITRNQQNGAFYITGTGGLPTNPGELATYSTGTVQPANAANSWKRGDAIVEPQGVYQLPNGALILSRECTQN